MRKLFKSRKWQVLAALAVVAFGAWAVPNARDKHEVAKMTEKMKTVCVGRLLIDLPEKAEYSLHATRIDGFYIGTDSESDEAFQATLKTREAEIRATPDYLGRDKNMEAVKDIRTDTGWVGKIFVFGRDVVDGYAGYGPDREHYHYENVAAEGYVHMNGLTVSLTTKDYDPDHVMGNLTKLIEKLVPNPDNHIPVEPGFCADRVFFRDPLVPDQTETTRLFIELPEHPEMDFSFDTAAGLKPDADDLLARNRAARRDGTLEDKARVTDLFADERAINGIPGQQLLTRFLGGRFSRMYRFMWDVGGNKDDVLRPMLTLELDAPKLEAPPDQTTLSESALLDLWDKISSSIRMRPTQAPKVSAAEPPAAPLCIYATAGNTCPQSGWWQCSDGGNGLTVHGGQRQYIRQGDPMPQALLLPAQTLWEKVRGLQPSFESPNRTIWKLVDRRSQRRVPPDVPLAQATATAPAAATAAAGAGAIERVSVGAYAITGNPCPASGWWRVQESDALDGTRWFAAGSLLPAATFTVPARSFGKTSDTTTAIQRRGTWQLVRLAQASEAAGDEPGQGA